MPPLSFGQRLMDDLFRGKANDVGIAEDEAIVIVDKLVARADQYPAMVNGTLATIAALISAGYLRWRTCTGPSSIITGRPNPERVLERVTVANFGGMTRARLDKLEAENARKRRAFTIDPVIDSIDSLTQANADLQRQMAELRARQAP